MLASRSLFLKYSSKMGFLRSSSSIFFLEERLRCVVVGRYAADGQRVRGWRAARAAGGDKTERLACQADEAGPVEKLCSCVLDCPSRLDAIRALMVMVEAAMRVRVACCGVGVVWLEGNFCGCGERLRACRGGESRQIFMSQTQRSALRRNVQESFRPASVQTIAFEAVAAPWTRSCVATRQTSRAYTSPSPSLNPSSARLTLTPDRELLLLHHYLIRCGPKLAWCT